MKNILYVFVLLQALAIRAQTPSACSYKGLYSESSALITQADLTNMNKYDVSYYKLDLELQNNNVYVQGNVVMNARVVADLTEITLQLHANMLIDSVKLNGLSATYTRADDVVKIQTGGTIASGASFQLITFYHGNATLQGSSAIGNGYTNILSKKVSWSLSEPFAASEWWPCKQVLTDKADSSDVWVTTDSVNKVGSNGLLQHITTMPGGKVRYEWKSTYPIAYYLISVAVCPYKEYNLYAHPAGSDSVLIQNYVYQDIDSVSLHSLQYTAPLMELFSQKFGLYPFANEKYGHCQSQMGGGMEHQTMSTMGYFNFSIIAHELGHQWFGDYVTSKSWSDLWLHEGFATYCEFVANEALMPGEKQSWIAQNMYASKNTTNSVYAFDSLNVQRLFDPQSTYAKGGILLRMLRYEINNDSLFFLGIRNYLAAHQYNMVTPTDFKTTMEQVSGKNFNTFFDQWYYSPGYPILEGRWNQWEHRVTLQITQRSTLRNTPFQTSLDVTIGYAGGDTTIRIWFDAITKTYEFDLGQKSVVYIKIDKENYVLKDLFSITKDITLSTPIVSGKAFANITLYPNPAHNQIELVHAAGCHAQIVDITGMLMEELDLDSSTAIDISGYAAGVYVVRLLKDGEVGYVKFVKQ